jgi:hypothetical protein
MAAKATFTEYNLPREAGSVPTSAGVYRFAVRLPTDYELGLTDSNVDIIRAVDVLKRKLNSLSRALHTRILMGSIADQKQSHLQMAYEIVGTASEQHTPAVLFDNVAEEISNVDELRDAIRLIRALVGELPPVYVGITVERTLRTRLLEHLDGSTGVLEELDRCGLSWTDIKFQCMAVPFYNRPVMRSIEKLLQHLHRPAFSKA